MLVALGETYERIGKHQVILSHLIVALQSRKKLHILPSFLDKRMLSSVTGRLAVLGISKVTLPSAN